MPLFVYGFDDGNAGGGGGGGVVTTFGGSISSPSLLATIEESVDFWELFVGISSAVQEVMVTPKMRIASMQYNFFMIKGVLS